VISQLGKYWKRHKKELEMLDQIKKFMLDEGGLETVEWAIIGGIVVAGVTVYFVSIGEFVLRGVTALDVETSYIPRIE
jgi:hypothetical protein